METEFNLHTLVCRCLHCRQPFRDFRCCARRRSGIIGTLIASKAIQEFKRCERGLSARIEIKKRVDHTKYVLGGSCPIAGTQPH